MIAIAKSAAAQWVNEGYRPDYNSCGKHDRITSVVSKGALPSRSAAEHHEAGIALASERRFAEAVKEYLEAARLNPNFSETFYNLGVAYGELGQSKAAINAYNRAIQLDPKDWQAYCNLGVDYVNSKQYAKAIDSFKRAAELNPKDMTLFVSIGYNCGRLKRYSEAIEAYSHAVELKPDFAIGWYNIGLFHSICIVTGMRSSPPKEHWPSTLITTNRM